jgi:hypothetical protein
VRQLALHRAEIVRVHMAPRKTYGDDPNFVIREIQPGAASILQCDGYAAYKASSHPVQISRALRWPFAGATLNGALLSNLALPGLRRNGERFIR